jgi:hypothetical protein
VTRTATGEKVSRARRLERFRRARSLGAVSPNDSIDRRARVVVSRRGATRTMRTMRAHASVLLGMVRGVLTHRSFHLFPGSASRDARRGWVRHSSARRDATLVREPCASIRRFVTP